ncbi:hypothetical protein FHG87_004707 [Trinorchestia longiramus]|nr:hypothetical protein FHG87_004707 [Trinorchestia longiramus]
MAVSVTESRTSDRSYTKDEDAKTLLKAMNNNAFNKLHYTYNKNLVDEDNQDMTSHMNWRREYAQRLSILAQIANNRPDSTGAEANHLEEGQREVDLPLQYQASVNYSINPTLTCSGRKSILSLSTRKFLMTFLARQGTNSSRTNQSLFM